MTRGGAFPSTSIALTRLSEARMSCSVGGAGTTTAGSSLRRPNHDLRPMRSARGQRGQVERARGVAGVVGLDPVEVGLRLVDLGPEDADRLRHRVERLQLELVDGVHGRVD